MRSRILLLLALICLPALLSACASPQQGSDWRWQQANPNYRLPYPHDSGSTW